MTERTRPIVDDIGLPVPDTDLDADEQAKLTDAQHYWELFWFGPDVPQELLPIVPTIKALNDAGLRAAGAYTMPEILSPRVRARLRRAVELEQEQDRLILDGQEDVADQIAIEEHLPSAVRLRAATDPAVAGLSHQQIAYEMYQQMVTDTKAQRAEEQDAWDAYASGHGPNPETLGM
jgi:hypothetical protein